MKDYRLLTIAFLTIFLAGGFFHHFRESRTKIKTIKQEHETLAIVLPGAQSFSKKTGTFPYYEAYKTSAQTDRDLIGFAFTTTDIVPEILGYAGPIRMLIGMNLQGNITKVHMLEHSETFSYVSKLNTFLDQFASKGINDSFELGRDVDGISRATITSNAITRAVGKSLKEAGSQILQLEKEKLKARKRSLPLEEILVPLLLFIIAIIGVLTHKQILRWIALTGGFLYFGVIKSTMISAVQIVNICLLKFPSFEQSPLWYMLIGLTLLSTLLFGMVFCGSLCPFAAVEEFLYNITHRKKKIEKRQLSYEIDQKARYIKYAILFTVICVGAFLGNSSTASIEPFLTLFTFHGTLLGWSLLIFMLIMAFFHFRFWCKYLCPVGACLGLFSRFSLFKIKLGKDCSQCSACEKICPTRAIRMDKGKLPKIDYPECILCGKCITICPKENLEPENCSHEDRK